ncbi:MAG: glycosyltransferase family 9 protein [Candidatus Eiseniibacteriota bacterium]
MMLPPSFRPARVLLIRPRGLGDIVLSTVVTEAVGLAWPGVAVDYLAEHSARDLLEADPRLDRIFLLGPRRADARAPSGGIADAIPWIRSARPQVVLDLFSNPRTALITALSGAPFRVGLDRGPRRIAYNVRVPRFRGRPEDDHRYAQDVQRDFLRAAGVRWTGEARACLRLGDGDVTFAGEALHALGYAAGSRFGIVLPGGSWESKRWTVAGYVAAGREMAARLGWPTLVVWGPPERNDAQAIADALGSEGRLAPPSRLRQMAALIGRAAAAVLPDCLGRHLAVVQDVPTVGVFGTTDPRDWTPPVGPHRTVRAVEHDAPELRALAPDPVVEEVRRLLAEVDSARART